MKVTPIDATVTKVDERTQRPREDIILTDWEYADQMVYGCSVKDKDGNRIDPKRIRVTEDGKYVIITE